MSELFLQPKASGEAQESFAVPAVATAAAVVVVAPGDRPDQSLDSPDGAPPTMLPLGARKTSWADFGGDYRSSPRHEVGEVAIAKSGSDLYHNNARTTSSAGKMGSVVSATANGDGIDSRPADRNRAGKLAAAAAAAAAAVAAGEGGAETVNATKTPTGTTMFTAVAKVCEGSACIRWAEDLDTSDVPRTLEVEKVGETDMTKRIGIVTGSGDCCNNSQEEKEPVLGGGRGASLPRQQQQPPTENLELTSRGHNPPEQATSKHADVTDVELGRQLSSLSGTVTAAAVASVATVCSSATASPEGQIGFVGFQPPSPTQFRSMKSKSNVTDTSGACDSEYSCKSLIDVGGGSSSCEIGPPGMIFSSVGSAGSALSSATSTASASRGGGIGGIGGTGGIGGIGCFDYRQLNPTSTASTPGSAATSVAVAETLVTAQVLATESCYSIGGEEEWWGRDGDGEGIFRGSNGGGGDCGCGDNDSNSPGDDDRSAGHKASPTVPEPQDVHGDAGGGPSPGTAGVGGGNSSAAKGGGVTGGPSPAPDGGVGGGRGSGGRHGGGGVLNIRGRIAGGGGGHEGTNEGQWGDQTTKIVVPPAGMLSRDQGRFAPTAEAAAAAAASVVAPAIVFPSSPGRPLAESRLSRSTTDLENMQPPSLLRQTSNYLNEDPSEAKRRQSQRARAQRHKRLSFADEHGDSLFETKYHVGLYYSKEGVPPPRKGTICCTIS